MRAFIIKSLRDALARTLNDNIAASRPVESVSPAPQPMNFTERGFRVCAQHRGPDSAFMFADVAAHHNTASAPQVASASASIDAGDEYMPLGRVIGQIGNKYILAQSGENLVIVDQHAAHERITYERLRRHAIKVQPLLTPIVVSLRAEDVAAGFSYSCELGDYSVRTIGFW